MYSGYSLGIVASALVAMALLPDFGWRAVVAVGALPILILPLVAYLLPESLEYLVSKGRITEAKAIAARQNIPNYVPKPPARGGAAVPWREVMATMFSLGYAADRVGQKLILVVFYILGTAGIMLLMFPNSMVVNLAFVAFAGIVSISTSLVLTGYIADYYPAATRATATGWPLSFVRIGAISGPIIGGWIAASGAPYEWNFAVSAIIGLIAAGAVAMIPQRVPQLDGTAAAAAGAAVPTADAAK